MAGGGAERQLVYLSGELVRRGWNVHMALLRGGPNFEGLASSGATIHKIPAWGNYDLFIFWRLMRLMRSVRPDLVQTWITQMDVFGGMASRLANIPYILSERSGAAAYAPTLKNRLRVRVGRYASAIVTNSVGGKHYWETQNRDSVPMYVVRNGLPLGEIALAVPSMNDFRILPSTKMLLFAGRLSPGKNIENLIRAFRTVSSQRDAILLVCGEGELRKRLEKKIRDENVNGRVIVAGYIKNVWGLMKRADAFVSVSTYEGHPNAVLEAMACGCPLVLSDIPAHRDFLDEEKAVFVEPGSPQQIAQAILTCIDNPEAARQMAQKAKAAASSFSIEAVVDQFEKVYKQVLSYPGGESR